MTSSRRLLCIAALLVCFVISRDVWAAPYEVQFKSGAVTPRQGEYVIPRTAVAGNPSKARYGIASMAGADPMFTPASENLLGVTQDLEFTHEVGTNQKYFYIIQASDDH